MVKQNNPCHKHVKHGCDIPIIQFDRDTSVYDILLIIINEISNFISI